MGEAGAISGERRFSVRPWLLPAVAMLVALALRAPGLDQRPFHTDEAVNAFIIEELFERGYQYRAHDHHGPLLYYVAGAFLGPLGITKVSQMDPWMLRLFSTGFGLALIGSVYWLQPYITRTAAHAAALILALAAPFAYYSGIFIHELLLLVLLMGFLASFLRMHTSGRRIWAVLAGTFAGLMLCTKETGALMLLVVGGAVIAACVVSWRKLSPNSEAVAHNPGGFVSTPGTKRRMDWRTLIARYLSAAIVAILVVLFIYSDFARKPERAFDLFRAVSHQIARGTGEEHAYPWWQYLAWAGKPTDVGVPWSGWILPVLGALGVWLNRKSRMTWALAGWAGALLVGFSILPYKTPWLMLAWLLPLALLSGVSIDRLLRRTPKPTALAGLVLAVLLANESIARCHRHAVAPTNPLAYSPTSMDQHRLEHDLDVIAAEHGGSSSLEVHVVAQDYWPLPWTLRKFPQKGFWTQPSQQSGKEVLLCGPEYLGVYATGAELRPYELRPGVFVFLRPPQ